METVAPVAQRAAAVAHIGTPRTARASSTATEAIEGLYAMKTPPGEGGVVISGTASGDGAPPPSKQTGAQGFESPRFPPVPRPEPQST